MSSTSEVLTVKAIKLRKPIFTVRPSRKKPELQLDGYQTASGTDSQFYTDWQDRYPPLGTGHFAVKLRNLLHAGLSHPIWSETQLKDSLRELAQSEVDWSRNL